MEKRTRFKRKHLTIIGLSIGVLSIIIFPPWVLVWAWILPLSDSVQEEVDEALRHDFDGIIVYVDQSGKPPAFYSAGWKNRENRVPADPHALFKIASVGKLYDAVAVAKLVNDNRLSLDKTIADYFPDLVGRIENADRITLRMMVQHRSGIPNFTDTPNFWADPSNINGEEALELILDQPANFEPDADYEYSNTNYLLITQLIEKVTGNDKFQYIKEEILTPLGLKNTYGSIQQVDIEDLMSGYYVGIEEDIKTADYGSMIATAEDVGIFLRALNDGSVFDEGEEEIYSSIYYYEHTGLIPGYQTIAKYHKDIDTVVTQFVNTTDFEGWTWTLSEIVYSRIVNILRSETSL